MSDRGSTLTLMYDELTDLERAILAFEKRRWNFRGMKERAIREELDISPTRYSQVLLALATKPAALVAEPMLVHRLQRRATAR